MYLYNYLVNFLTNSTGFLALFGLRLELLIIEELRTPDWRV
jgi:hypothetical protein